jgi:small basic protein
MATRYVLPDQLTLLLMLMLCRLSVQAADPPAGLHARYVLPDQLTPHRVHALLSDLRASAAQVRCYLSSNSVSHVYVSTVLNARLLCAGSTGYVAFNAAPSCQLAAR